MSDEAPDLELNTPLAVLASRKGIICIAVPVSRDLWRIGSFDREEFIKGGKTPRFTHEAQCYYSAEIGTRQVLVEMKDAKI